MLVTEISETKVHEIVDRWHSRESFVIEMLQDLQREARHLPRANLEQIAREVGVPTGRLYHLATFFKGFSLKPRGEHTIQVCLGSACHIKGATRVLESFTRHLGIQPGETTPDGLFSLEPVRCLGCCGLAAVVTIGDDLFGNVTSVTVPRLIKKFQRTQEAPPVAAATGASTEEAES